MDRFPGVREEGGKNKGKRSRHTHEKGKRSEKAVAKAKNHAEPIWKNNALLRRVDILVVLLGLQVSIL